MDDQLTKEDLNKYLRLLQDDARPEGVLRLQHARDNLDSLMDYVNRRDSVGNRKEVLALEFKKDKVASGTVPRRDLNVVTPSTSVKTTPAGDDRFQVTETGLVVHRRTLHRQSLDSLQSSKFEVVTVKRLGEKVEEAIVKCVPGPKEGSLLVKHGGSLTWVTKREMVLKFRDFDAAFLLVTHMSVDKSLVESGRPLPSKLRRFLDAGDDEDSPVVSILNLDENKSLLHVSLKASEIRQGNKFDSSENSNMWRRSPERSSKIDDGERSQAIERNIRRIVDKRTTQKAVSVLVKRFGFDKVREAFDSALDTHVLAQNTNSSSFSPLETRDLRGHHINIDSTASSFSSAPRHAPSIDSTGSRLSEAPKGLLGVDQGTGSVEPPYKKSITEASWGESEEEVDEEIEQSIVEEVEMKHQSGLLRRNSESPSIVSCQTQETTIHELAFPERILHEIREITRTLQKVSIVVSTQTDGKTLADFIASKGYKAKLVPREDLDTGSYDHIIYTNQAIIVPVEDWKMMKKEHKQKTTFLIMSLREGQTDGTYADFQDFQHFEGFHQIPFVREELPRTYSSISDEMPDMPLRQRKQQNTESTLLEKPSKPTPPCTPVVQSISSQIATSTKTVSGFQQETASRMFVDLQSFTKQTISELAEEARAQGVQDFEELSHDHYRSYDNFVNQLSSWITGTDKTVMRECVRLHLLKETLRAVSFVYLIGSENTKGLIAPSIRKMYEQSGRVYGPDQADVKAINSMEEIMNDPPESFDYEETVFFQALIEKLKDWQDLRPFHGVVVVHSRINVWAIAELLGRHPEFQETTIFPLYSPSKDLTVYGANKALKMTPSQRSEALKDFNRSDSGILVTVSVAGIENKLTNVDLLILFGCTSAVQANSIKATKKWNIEIAFGTTGKIAEIN